MYANGIHSPFAVLPFWGVYTIRTSAGRTKPLPPMRIVIFPSESIVIIKEMLAHKFSSLIFNDYFVFHTGAVYPAGMERCTVRFPMREMICFFCIGITMANYDISGDVAAAF